jgi:hypothetical protein
MLATKTEACREYAYAVGSEHPTRQWILTDYDTWEPNPFYVGPDGGHPEYPDEDGPMFSVFMTFKEASEYAKGAAQLLACRVSIERYKDRCWVVKVI